MEVVVPVPVPMADHFHFDSTSTPPFVSAVSSPTALTSFPFCHNYASAPTSPSSAFIPFDWESKPGTPKYHRNSSVTSERGDSDSDDGTDVDFAFEFRGHVVPGGASAATPDELFEAGKIRPLKLPPRLQQVSSSLSTPPKSPTSAISRLLRRGKKEEEEFDPFAKAIEETTRGRERDRWVRGSEGSRKATRSASPLRAVLFDCAAPSYSSRTSTIPKSSSGGSSGKKWRLKDLLLFRSASEGRAMGGGSKDMLRKYRVLLEESGGGSSRGSRGGGGGGGWVSAHVRHSMTKRAVSEETKKKTFLPYRKGLLARLGLNPDVHRLVKGFGSFLHGRS